jgi:hypothetical protein
MESLSSTIVWQFLDSIETEGNVAAIQIGDCRKQVGSGCDAALSVLASATTVCARLIWGTSVPDIKGTGRISETKIIVPSNDINDRQRELMAALGAIAVFRQCDSAGATAC